MIVNMIWHVLQKVVKCYLVPLPRLSSIYWLIHFNIPMVFLKYVCISYQWSNEVSVSRCFLIVIRKETFVWPFSVHLIMVLLITTNKNRIKFTLDLQLSNWSKISLACSWLFDVGFLILNLEDEQGKHNIICFVNKKNIGARIEFEELLKVLIFYMDSYSL